jgi:hypothetical protein
MPQILKGDTFANSQQLTAARLNQLVDSAQILVGAITEQPVMTPNTLTATDSTIINDGGTLKQITVNDILNSGLPVTTPTVTATANSDVIVTPLDGVFVAGSNYTSVDGLTVVVTTLSPHGLSVNNVVLISGAGTGYNGTFIITNVTSTTFTYVMYTAATPTASPTACTYVRKATEIVNGHIVASGSVFVKDNVDTNNLQVDGQADINTSTTKTANVTSAMQYSGVPVWGLASVTDTAIPFTQCDATTEAQRIATCNQWRNVLSISSLTKTNKELWQIEVNFPVVVWSQWYSKFRVIIQSSGVVIAHENLFFQTTSAAFFYTTQIKITAVVPEGTVLTNDSLVFQFRYQPTLANASSILNVGYGGPLVDPEVTRVFRLTKYAKP